MSVLYSLCVIIILSINVFLYIYESNESGLYVLHAPAGFVQQENAYSGCELSVSHGVPPPPQG